MWMSAQNAMPSFQHVEKLVTFTFWKGNGIMNNRGCENRQIEIS